MFNKRRLICARGGLMQEVAPRLGTGVVATDGGAHRARLAVAKVPATSYCAFCG